MESDSIKHCINCHNRHITTVAVMWCPNCEEGFCSDCEKFHNASKLAKLHTTIPMVDYNKLSPFIAEIKSHCEEHHEIYEFYCKSHGQCCCSYCLLESHHKCDNFDILREAVKNVKSAPALEDVEISLKHLGDIFQKLKENRLENKARLEEQRTKFLEEVQCIRNTVNNHLDKIENIVKQKIASQVEMAQSQIHDVLQELEERSNMAIKLRDEVVFVKQTATDLQIFLLLELLQKRINEESKYLEGLEHKLDEIDLNLNVSTYLTSLSEELDSFAEITCSNKTNTLSVSIGNKDQAQILSPHDISASDIQVVNKLKISYPLTFQNCIITGCTILPDEQLLYVDSKNNTLSMSNSKGDFRDVITFDVNTWDVAYLCNSKAAITLTGQKIAIVDLLLGVHVKTFDAKDKCWGVDYINGELIVKVPGSFLIMDDDGNILSNIKGDCLTHVSASQDKIFGTNYKDSSVLCYDKNGSVIWKFNDPILKRPQDLSIDNKGFVYVVGETSNNVVVISPDGKSCKEILNKSDGLDKPKAIHFEKTLNKLLICNESNDAFLCNISV